VLYLLIGREEGIGGGSDLGASVGIGAPTIIILQITSKSEYQVTATCVEEEPLDLLSENLCYSYNRKLHNKNLA